MVDNTYDFESCVNSVLQEEGGYVNNPADPGGETQWGISKRAFPDVDIKALTKDGAKEIYLNHYWKPLEVYGLHGLYQKVAFECAVNQGVDRCKRLLDQSKGQLEWFMADRALAYIALPTFATFGKGWLRRLFKEMV